MCVQGCNIYLCIIYVCVILGGRINKALETSFSFFVSHQLTQKMLDCAGKENNKLEMIWKKVKSNLGNPWGLKIF